MSVPSSKIIEKNVSSREVKKNFVSLHKRGMGWGEENTMQGLGDKGTGFPNQGFQVQITWVAPSSTQTFILPRSIKSVAGSPRHS